MFAAHHRLANLVALVDVNGQQALGYTRDVLDLGSMTAHFRAFGWDVHEVDGHAVEELDARRSTARHDGRPSACRPRADNISAAA